MTRRFCAVFVAMAVSVALVPMISASPATAARAPLRCARQGLGGKGFRICSGAVLSRDRTVKLAADVTLPSSGNGPFPLVVMLHGPGGSKLSGQLTQSDFAGDPALTIEGSGGRYRLNNLWFASRGYAVLNFTARGLGDSTCVNEEPQSADGDPELYEPSPACFPQLSHLGHDVADVQWLVGRLVDGTLLSADAEVARNRIGIQGLSLGAATTWLLTRRNVWPSPQGTRIRLAAAAPIIGWTDFVEAFLPNGTARDDVPAPPTLAEREAQRIGVLRSSFATAFYLLTQASAGGNLPGYFESWYQRLGLGEPFDGDPIVADALHKLLRNRSAYYVKKTTKPDTPILTVQGFTDQIFTAIQSLRMQHKLLAQRAEYPLRVYLGDWGHPAAQNKPDETAYISTLINSWFDHYLRGRGTQPGAVVEARLTDCDEGSSMGALYRAEDWPSLHPTTRTFQFGSGALATPVDDPHASVLTPARAFVANNECRTTDTEVAGGSVAFSEPVTEDLTMLGLPQVTLRADPTTAGMYVAARLFDVNETTQEQTLVDRGVYRLGSDEEQLVFFQLSGNGYRFEAGHSLKLELTADDSNAHAGLPASFDGHSIAVSDVVLSVPLADAAKLVAESSEAAESSAVGPAKILPRLP